MLEIDKIVDKTVNRIGYWNQRFLKNKVYEEIQLSVTKNGEQYYLLKRDDIEERDYYSYYIVNEENEVIGRFFAGRYENRGGITYHILPEYQNRGIGQLVLSVVVDDLFNMGYELVRILAINERSKAIALKNGFVLSTKMVYILPKLDYEKRCQNNNLR